MSARPRSRGGSRKIVDAPFIKVEATKFTEVGYVGRDVESIVRDLVEIAISMLHGERMEPVKDEASRRGRAAAGRYPGRAACPQRNRRARPQVRGSEPISTTQAAIQRQEAGR